MTGHYQSWGQLLLSYSCLDGKANFLPQLIIIHIKNCSTLRLLITAMSHSVCLNKSLSSLLSLPVHSAGIIEAFFLLLFTTPTTSPFIAHLSNFLLPKPSQIFLVFPSETTSKKLIIVQKVRNIILILINLMRYKFQFELIRKTGEIVLAEQ